MNYAHVVLPKYLIVLMLTGTTRTDFTNELIDADFLQKPITATEALLLCAQYRTLIEEVRQKPKNPIVNDNPSRVKRQSRSWPAQHGEVRKNASWENTIGALLLLFQVFGRRLWSCKDQGALGSNVMTIWTVSVLGLTSFSGCRISRYRVVTKMISA